MKPLKIEELKAGEWVWVVDIESPKHGSGYWQIHGFAETHIHLIQGPSVWVAPKALYGKDWVAYKNKEQAETKGEWVELREPRIEPSNSIYGGYSIYWQKIVEDTAWCRDKSQAEARLAELKKE